MQAKDYVSLRDMDSIQTKKPCCNTETSRQKHCFILHNATISQVVTSVRYDPCMYMHEKIRDLHKTLFLNSDAITTFSENKNVAF